MPDGVGIPLMSLPKVVRRGWGVTKPGLDVVASCSSIPLTLAEWAWPEWEAHEPLKLLRGRRMPSEYASELDG